MVAIIKEFYTNTKEAQGHVMQVWGKVVSFDKVSINAYYRTRDMEDNDEFTEYRHEEPDWDELIKCLCRPRADWKLRGTEALHFSHSELSRYRTAWYYFICAKFCQLHMLMNSSR